MAPEVLFGIGSLPVTNTLLMSWIACVALTTFAFLLRRKIALVPGKLQTTAEIIIGGVHGFVSDTLESRDLANKYFPLLATAFLYILVANWMEFIPGVESIIMREGEHAAPLLRSMNSDLNMTLALSVIVFLLIEISGIVTFGFFRYFSRFLNFHSAIGFVVGIIEFISEFIRLVSFSFRLFGNIFAGSVLIMVIIHFAPYVVPVPFMAFELFVGFMQAAIFSMLTLFFLKLAITEQAH